MSDDVVATDPDYVWRPWDLMMRHELVIGLVSTVTLVVTGWLLVTARRRSGPGSPATAAVVVLAVFGAWVGLGYRIMTAATLGANIGAGLVVMGTPALVFVEVVGVVVWRAARATPPRPGAWRC